MEIIYVLIGCSFAVALVFLGAFFWSIRSGQYEDTYTPAVRILFDSIPENPSTESSNPDNSK
jgi:cbb3-type cytochrome oxidase maturation protein